MNSDTVKIENLRIRVEEGLVIEITPEKAIKLRDALLEIFPSAPSAPGSRPPCPGSRTTVRTWRIPSGS